MHNQEILPVYDSISSVWFEGVKHGKLLIQRNPVTGSCQFYPRAHLVGLPEVQPEWIEASGKATLYTYTTVHRSVHPQFVALAPFVIGVVTLEEGVRMTAWIVDVPQERLACDIPLKVVFREVHPNLTLPCFTEV
ncbi:Zn-ribbon domain-containing OB-fold protein [Pseudomonas sp. O230]|uniref:Zn-ribbon domain-containing OB-fold protein n=1 Tax=Pseudomonas sp. O230 TaxID=3159450 RepID=UPI00387AF895